MSLEGSAKAAELRGKINYTDVLCIDAYGIAVQNGFEGTKEEWLASLVGPTGKDGKDGVGIEDIYVVGDLGNGYTAIDILLSDGRMESVQIPNGINGSNGIGINNIFTQKNDDGRLVLVIQYDDVDYTLQRIVLPIYETGITSLEQTTGDSETAVMSQKAVTEALKNIGGSEDITNIPKVIDNCQSTNGWNAVTLGNLTASLQADTTDFLYGSQSVRFTGCIQKHNLGIKVADGELRIKFKINSIDNGAAFVLMASDDSNFTNFTSWTLFDASIIEHRNTNLTAKVGEWTEMALPWAGLENISVLEKVSIFNTLRFRFLNGNGDANVQMIMTQPTKEPRGLLTITFDDGCKAQYTKAAKILGERGLKATAYIIPDIVGVSEGCMTEEQLVSLKYDYGWDIQGHWGEEMREYTDEQLKESFESVQTWLKGHGLGECEHFAYAGGYYEGNVEKIARNYFKTARTIAGSQTRGITSIKITNPYRLASISSVSDTSNMSGFNNILDRITRISKYGGWLILTFHDIGDTATAMFCSEAGFAQLLDHAIASGVDIKTMAEAMRGNV